MKMTFAKALSALALAAVAAGSQGQPSSSAVHVEIEESGTPPKPGRPPKRIITAPRGAEVRTFSFGGMHPFGADPAGQTTIVQTSELEPSAASDLKEDLAVMARILQKTCAEFAADSERVMGLDIVIHGGRARNLYIEDYGVLFTVNVDIPLRATEKKKAQGEEAPHANEEWHNAREELFGPRRPMAPKLSGEPLREFRAEDVNRLKNELVDALRNAANIRGLKNEDWVTILVRGRADSWPEGAGEHELLIGGMDLSEGGSSMVLKVKKGEIDALSKGLPKDEFRKRVVVRTY